MSDDWQVVEEALRHYAGLNAMDAFSDDAKAALARLREREAQLERSATALGEELVTWMKKTNAAESEAEAAEARVAELRELKDANWNQAVQAEARIAVLERDIEDWKAQAHVWNALEAQDRVKELEAALDAGWPNLLGGLRARVARLEEALRVIAEGGYGDASAKARRALAHEEEA